MTTYQPTPQQEQAIREWLQEAIVPLIEHVLVKKLGQAMSFAAQEIVQPKYKRLTDEEIDVMWREATIKPMLTSELVRTFAKAIEARILMGGKT